MNEQRQNEIFLEWIQLHDAIPRKISRVYAPSGHHAELYQDLLIAIWRAVPLYRGEAKPSTFLYRVALNCAMSWTRNHRVYRERHAELNNKMPAAPPSEPRIAQLYAALGELSEADRSLALLYLDDLSYREIADVLGITENNVGVRLNRIKKRLEKTI